MGKKYFVPAMLFLMMGAWFVWTTSLTISLVSLLLPNMTWAGWFAVGLFDGATVVWLCVFMYNARGDAQRSLALGGVGADVLGIALVSLAELYLGGQTLATIPDWIKGAPIWVITAWTVINIILGLTYHITDPDRRKAARKQAQLDKIADRTLDKTDEKIEEITDRASEELADQRVEEVLIQLGVSKRAHDYRKPSSAQRASAPKLVYNSETEIANIDNDRKDGNPTNR